MVVTLKIKKNVNLLGNTVQFNRWPRTNQGTQLKKCYKKMLRRERNQLEWKKKLHIGEKTKYRLFLISSCSIFTWHCTSDYNGSWHFVLGNHEKQISEDLGEINGA